MKKKTPDTKGRVILAGAGPGDPELVTLKLLRCLHQADVVLSDYLIPAGLKKEISGTCQWIDVGKKGMNPDRRNTQQDEINAYMRKYANEGKTVLRLKGGDPFIFGRAGEECEFLQRHNISFEIIPGVSSILSSADYAGIPITHRKHSRSFAVLTGHFKEGEDITKIQIPEVDTLIIAMGIKNIKILMKKIIDKGWEEETPCAVVQSAGTPNQKVTLTNLKNIRQNNEKFVSPATIIVGEVARLHEKLKWFEKRQLHGKNILLTRPYEESKKISKRLVQAGASVHITPMIALKRHRQKTYLGDAALKEHTDIIFTSAHAVRYFIEYLLEFDRDLRVMAHLNIIAIGETTERELKNHGIAADQTPAHPQSEGILDLLPANLSGRYFLLPTAAKTRDILPKGISERNGRCTKLVLYENVFPEEIALPPLDAIDAICFASSSAVENFFAHVQKLPHRVKCFAIGTVTAEAIRKYGKWDIFTADYPSGEDLIKKIIDTIALQ